MLLWLLATDEQVVLPWRDVKHYSGDITLWHSLVTRVWRAAPIPGLSTVLRDLPSSGIDKKLAINTARNVLGVYELMKKSLPQDYHTDYHTATR